MERSTTMMRIPFLLFLLGGALFASSAGASQSRDREAANGSAQATQGAFLLAQNSDLQVFYDGNGNRVFIDAATGEVVAVQPPRTRLDRRALRRQQRQSEREPLDDGYYLDDPQAPSRARRRQMEAERRAAAPRADEHDPYGGDPEDGLPEAPRDDGYYDAYPRDGAPEQPIARAPLDEASIEPSQPQDEIEVPPSPALSDGGVRVDPSLSLGSRQDVAALQVLLDRAGASPGVIDGRFGSNVDKALKAYRQLTGVHLRTTDTVAIKEALAKTGGDAFATYTITAQDAAGPYVASVPSDYGAKAQLERLSYTSVTEALAERFHMDETYLKALNPGVDFNRPGTIVKVANFGRLVNVPVVRILADKGLKQVRAYGADGKLVAAYPATIGSTDTPSPTGIHAVSRVAFNPNYTYNPKINFKQGDNDKVLTIPPGPNGPVGSVWIALDKPTYGIHGTPDPSKIGKTASHGCVRLTNWDATELAKLVKPGVTVEFVD